MLNTFTCADINASKMAATTKEMLVTAEDFERSLKEVIPAFGVKGEELEVRPRILSLRYRDASISHHHREWRNVAIRHVIAAA